MNEYAFKARYARRLPDPTFPNAERHIFLCSVSEVPRNIPKGANPRTQDDIDRGIYKDVRLSLFNEDCTPNSFHLKNKGITIIADKVKKSEDNDDLLYLTFSSENQGIVDGAHTYELIVQNQGIISDFNNSDENQINQFVKFEVLTGIDIGLITEIAGGLNTAVQVQRMSLAELDNKFEWVKEELKKQKYERFVAFKQNEPKEYDVRDVLRLLHLFNIFEYPNSGVSYPLQAYTSKESVLKHYLDNKNDYFQNYQNLKPILNDILQLHDLVSMEAPGLYNKGQNKRAGSLKFVEKNKKGKFEFPFTNQFNEYRLTRGALYPMLGAFRAMVIEDAETGLIKWKNNFSGVITMWRDIGKELMEATQETSEELGRNPNAIGKSKKHWAYLHNLVLKKLQ
jgi:hypothetical protein